MLNLLVCFIILLSTIVTPLPVFGDTHYGEVTGGQVNEALANTAHVKLSWLLANYPKKEVETLISQNLRGEINERLEYQKEFI